MLPLLPAHLARLWSRALETAIEPDWVQASILSRRLAPPPHAGPQAWPWPVKLRVLGSFSCEVDGTDLTLASAGAGSKAASRPLALLRRIAAEGGHEGVATDTVAEALWPGEGREGRHKALEVTLARLRRLLGCTDAVLLHDRRLRLHPQRVWLDLVALAALLDQIECAGAASADASPRADPWPAVWTLWRGPPLADDPEQADVQALRERWRARLGSALQAWTRQPGHESRRLRALATDPALAAWI